MFAISFGGERGEWPAPASHEGGGADKKPHHLSHK